MRESKIEAYDPGVQFAFLSVDAIFGVFAPLWLSQKWGLCQFYFLWLSSSWNLWYVSYAGGKVVGQGQFTICLLALVSKDLKDLTVNSRIMKEKGVREEDPFDEVVLEQW
ncbi:MAG: hypothetical protein CM1200mP30_24550 [Pseudomonadota bacterium]|nr:MAG: hypothetical protein CM1200mP30_24550 [Pseudomonadota bacterium]